MYDTYEKTLYLPPPEYTHTEAYPNNSFPKGLGSVFNKDCLLTYNICRNIFPSIFSLKKKRMIVDLKPFNKLFIFRDFTEICL